MKERFLRIVRQLGNLFNKSILNNNQFSCIQILIKNKCLKDQNNYTNWKTI